MLPRRQIATNENERQCNYRDVARFVLSRVFVCSARSCAPLFERSDRCRYCLTVEAHRRVLQKESMQASALFRRSSRTQFMCSICGMSVQYQYMLRVAIDSVFRIYLSWFCGMFDLVLLVLLFFCACGLDRL